MAVDFNKAVDGPFRHLGEAATYKAGGAGAGSAVTVIARRPDVLTAFDETRLASASTMLDARASEVASPQAGDTFTLGDGTVLVVQGKPLRDERRLVWTIDTHPAGA